MKKYINNSFGIIFSLILVVGLFSFPLEADAIGYCSINGKPDMSYGEDQKDKCIADGGRWVDTLTGTAEEIDLAGTTESPGVLAKVLWGFVAFVVGMILKFVALLTGLGGSILNGVVYHTIVNVSANYRNFDPIKIAWGVLRDIANMTFIFVLLYAGIRTILGAGSENKKIITNVIVAAVLMNFSLFFTGVVIDISNVFALTFYDAIVPGVAGRGFLSVGLSDAFMQHLSITSLYAAGGKIDVNGIITTGLMGSIMLLIAAFVFFSVAIMFIIRYVILILVMILSPIYFVSLALPAGTGIETYKKKWYNALMGQAFFAPIYFLLTWVSVQVMGGIMKALGAPGGSTSAAGTLSELTLSGALTSGSMIMFINFGIVITLIITSLVVAKEWADKAGSGVSKLTSWATNTAGTMSAGLAGKAGRETFGRAGQWIADNDRVKDWAADSRVGRLALAAGKKAGGSSFDFRASRAGGATLGIMDGGSAGGKGGYKQKREDTVKRRMEEAERFNRTVTGADVEAAMAARPGNWSKAENERLGRTPQEVERVRRQVQAQLVAQARNTTLGRQERFLHNISQTRTRAQNMYSSVSDDAEAARRLREGKGAQMHTAARLEESSLEINEAVNTPGATVSDIEEVLKDITEKEIEAIVESNRALLSSLEFANALSTKQLEALNKSEKISESEKDTMLGRRFHDIDAAMAVGTPAAIAGVATRIKDLPKAELELIDADYLSNPEFVANLSADQVKNIQDSYKFTATQKTALKTQRAVPLNNAFTAGRWYAPPAAPGATPTPLGAIQIMERMGEASLAKLDAGYVAGNPATHTVPHLNNPMILGIYSPSVLNKLAAQSDLSAPKRAAIREAITRAVTRDPLMSSVLAMLVPAPGQLRISAADRAAALSLLPTPGERNLVASADWLESENGQQIF